MPICNSEVMGLAFVFEIPGLAFFFFFFLVISGLLAFLDTHPQAFLSNCLRFNKSGDT